MGTPIFPHPDLPALGSPDTTSSEAPRNHAIMTKLRRLGGLTALERHTPASRPGVESPGTRRMLKPAVYSLELLQIPRNGFGATRTARRMLRPASRKHSVSTENVTNSFAIETECTGLRNTYQERYSDSMQSAQCPCKAEHAADLPMRPV